MGINLIVTVDVDNDGVEHNERNNLSWNSLETIPEIKSILSEMKLKVTWFVRADNQLRDIYGSVTYVLEEHNKLWSQIEDTGDEIGWHPHIYEWSEIDKLYVPDLDDTRRSGKLKQIRAELLKEGYNHTSARMGEAFHTNESMETLEYLFIKVDATAIPGRSRNDVSRCFNWSMTPNEPYHPSKTDYRIPSQYSHWNILEVPMTTAPIKTGYDPIPLVRYFNPLYHYHIFKSAIEWFLRTYNNHNQDYFLTLVFHPDEVIPRNNSHELYAFSINEMKQNINYLLSVLEQNKIPCKSITVSEVKEIIDNKTNAGIM